MADLKYELTKQDEPTSNDCDSKPEVMIHERKAKKLTPKQRTLAIIIIAVVAFIAFMFLIGLIVLGVQVSKLKSKIKDMKDSAPCTTVECINSVSDIMSSVDPSIDPCEDFEQYACGKWPEKNPLPFGEKTWQPLHKLRVSNEQTIQRVIQRKYTRIRYSRNEALRKVFSFYDSCMDLDAVDAAGSQPLLDLIAQLGSCPYFNSTWHDEDWDFIGVVSTIHRDVPISVFFQLFIGVLDSNTSVHTLMTSFDGLGLRTSRYNSSDAKDVKIKTAYRKYMVDLLKLLGVSANQSVEMMESVFGVEKDLALLSPSLRGPRNHKLLKIKDMDANNTNGLMNWMKLFKNIFRYADFTPDENTVIKAYDPDYYPKLNKYLNSKPKRDLANYIVWTVINRYSKLLSKRFLKPYQDYIKVFEIDSSHDVIRWEKCIAEVKEHFGMAVGRMFVDEAFRNGSKRDAIELVNDIKRIFIDDFDSVDWMDEATRVAAKAKAKAMHSNVGYPDFIMDDAKLAALYKQIDVQNNTYFDNVISIEKSFSLVALDTMGKIPSRTKWVITPTTINAAYAPTSNTMDIPAGILQKPLFHHNYPRSINFGAIGAIIGHEMTHGFDTLGKRFNQFGHGKKWWSNSSNENFQKKSECFVNQYQNFTYKGLHLNGRRVLGEVIADNGGTEIAFKAYKLWEKENGKEQQLPGIKLTHDQVFFVAYAQIFCSIYTKDSYWLYMNRAHPINPLRVKGVAMNSKEFAKAFQCPVGSPMNPERKCKIW